MNPTKDTWNDIAMPILRVLQEMEDEAHGNGRGTNIDELAKRLDMGANLIGPQLDSLQHGEFITVQGNRPTSGRPHRHFGITLLPEGRRALGEWPADPMASLANALARALDKASEAANDPEDRSRLRVLADGVRKAGAALGPAVAAEALRALFGV